MKTPANLDIKPLPPNATKEQVIQEYNELVRKLDEVHRLRSNEIREIEKRLDDGGL
jgi:hypothetical protein